MRHRHLLALFPLLAAGACVEVLGLDEPTVREGGGGGSTTSGPTTGSTGAGTTSSSAGGGGPGGQGPGGGPGATGGGGSGGCSAHVDCDDENPCTIDVCSDGACVNEASGTDPVDDPDDCVDIACAGDVPAYQPDDTEVAAHPNPPCHTAVCQGGVAVDVFAAVNTPCGEAPLVCDGEGACTGCTVDADCAGAEGPCSAPTCLGSGVCDPGILEQGTVVDDPVGNCRTAVCTGASSTPNLAYTPDDLPPPMTCAEVSCTQEGPRIQEANDGTPCTVGDLVGVCNGSQVGDAACVQCEDQGDCQLQPGGGRCTGESVCGCAFAGDCQGYWRAGAACIPSAGADVCGCNVAADCNGNMHGDACVGDACGCVNADDCVGSELGATCVAGEARCGCSDDAECTTSELGRDCLAGDLRCGCDTDEDCGGLGGTCVVALGICN